MIRALKVCFTVFIVSGATSAQAAETDNGLSNDSVTQDRALAEALFRDGKSLVEQGRVEEACAKFKESERLDPALGTLLHLATCYSQAGRTASAWAAFQSARELAHRRKDKEREAIARERAAALEPKLSNLRLSISIPVVGMEIRVDGRILGPAALSTPLPFDPGTHTIEVTAPGKRAWQQTVELDSGPSTLPVRIPALEEDTPAKTAPENAPHAVVPVAKPAEAKPATGTWRPTLGYVSLGVGAAALGAGTYFGLRAYGKANDANKHCSGSICDQSGLDGYTSARTAANLSNVGFALGIVGIAAGTYLLVSSPHNPTNAQTALWVGAGPGNIAAGGQF